MRRCLAAALAVVWIVSLTMSMTVQCAGWQGTAAERAACCREVNHDGGPAHGSPDDCCGQSEQSRQAFTAGAITAIVKPVTLTVAILDLLAIQSQVAHTSSAARAFEAHALTIPHESPHLVFSVFRI